MTCADAADLAAGFVLGALDPDEAAAVRRHLATCPEPHAEFAELGGVVPYLAAAATPSEPSPALRGRILAAVGGDGVRDTGIRPLGRRSASRWTTGLLAVAASLAVAFGATSWWLAGRLSEAQGYADRVAQAAALAAEPGSRTVALTGAADAGSPAARGLAVIPSAGSGIVVVSGLAPTSGAQVYVAWIVEPGGAPVPAGAFTVSDSGRGALSGLPRPSSGAFTVALTLEPRAGATTPTLPIVAAGSVGG